MVINSDKGGGGVKNWDLYGDILFEWPLTYMSYVYLWKILSYSFQHNKFSRHSLQM